MVGRKKMDLRLMSFNSRYDSKRDGINSWKNRKSLIAEIIHQYSPDIVGFQEVLKHQLKDLNILLPDYESYGVGRDNGRVKGEFNPIFYRNLKFDQMKTFWLSNTPKKPSKYRNAMKRIVTWGQMSHPGRALILNTHFSVRSKKARLASISNIENFLKTHDPSIPVVLMGDFNFPPVSEEFQKMKELFMNGFEVADPSELGSKVTFHDWTGVTENKTDGPSPHFIDFFWVNDKVKVKKIQIVTDCPGTNPDIYPSDHWPIMVDIEI